MRPTYVILAVVLCILAGAWLGGRRAAAPPKLDRWLPSIRLFADEFDVDADLVRAVVAAESSGDAEAKSPAGALGLMQLMPATAAEQAAKLRIEDYSTERLTEPELNLRLGTAYLAWLLERFEGDEAFALAAYNAGIGRVRQWREAAPDVSAREVIEREGFDETRTYVRRVLRYREAYAEE